MKLALKIGKWDRRVYEVLKYNRQVECDEACGTCSLDFPNGGGLACVKCSRVWHRG